MSADALLAPNGGSSSAGTVLPVKLSSNLCSYLLIIHENISAQQTLFNMVDVNPRNLLVISALSLIINSLWLGDATYGHRSESTLAQVMVCSWRHQTFTWINVDFSLASFCISRQIPKLLFCKMSLKKVPIRLFCKMSLNIKLFELLLHLLGANELTNPDMSQMDPKEAGGFR